MALLRWIHMRKLVPLTELLGGVAAARLRDAGRGAIARGAEDLSKHSAAKQRRSFHLSSDERQAHRRTARSAESPSRRSRVSVSGPGEGGRDAFLLEIRKGKAMFYNTVVAQAQKIEFGPERVTFSFLPAHRMLREQVETNKQWLEQIASAVAGKRMTVGAAQAEGVPEPVAAAARAGTVATEAARSQNHRDGRQRRAGDARRVSCRDRKRRRD